MTTLAKEFNMGVLRKGRELTNQIKNMLQVLMSFCLMFLSSPQVAQKAPGDYLEIVKTSYDQQTNETYAVFARYYISPENQMYVYWMEPVPFVGKPTEQQILQTASVDYGITVTNLTK